MRSLIAAVVLLAALAAPANAQDADADEDVSEAIILYHPPADNFITVLATGADEPLSYTGVAVSVFDRSDIEAVQGPDIARLLQRAPGVALSRNGGTGSFTGLRIRGAEAEQLLVLIDGVRMADPAAPGAGFDLGTLMAGNLSKVQLQRSSNSTIWGSQALGGVLAVTSGPSASSWGSWPQPELAVEYGAFDSLYASASAHARQGPALLAISGGWRQSDGFSAAASGSEADGHRQADFATRLRVDIADGWVLFAQGRIADARVDIDGFPAPTYALADTAEYQDSRQVAGAAGLNWYGDDIDLRLLLSQARTTRQNHDPEAGPEPTFTSRGTSQRAELRGATGSVVSDWQLHFGGDYERQAFETLFDVQQSTGAGGAYVQAEYDNDELHVAGGIRRDQHRQFGGEWSLGGDVSWQAGDDLTLSASYGEGFKAPSLFQLLSDYGNGRLDPERARSFDAGLRLDMGNRYALSLTGFRRNTRGQIVFVGCFESLDPICVNRPDGTYDNVARARSQGLEAEGTARLADGLQAALAYAFTASTNRDTGLRLARRPRHAGTLTLDWRVVEPLSLGADLRVVSASFDDPDNTVRLGGHALLDLRASWAASDHVELFSRIENAWDELYQTAAGYATQGRAAFVGVRARL